MPIDLIAHGIKHGIVRNSPQWKGQAREVVEIPSCSFVAKCSETKAVQPKGHPLPPD